MSIEAATVFCSDWYSVPNVHVLFDDAGRSDWGQDVLVEHLAE
jgi:hypothetical protein